MLHVGDHSAVLYAAHKGRSKTAHQNRIFRITFEDPSAEGISVDIYIRGSKQDIYTQGIGFSSESPAAPLDDIGIPGGAHEHSRRIAAYRHLRPGSQHLAQVRGLDRASCQV